MNEIEISKQVIEVLKFLNGGVLKINEKIVILKSAAELLNQIIMSEIVAASLVANFNNISNKK